MQKIMASKPCSRCGEVKPLDDYHNDKRAKDGKGSQCKECSCAAAKAWRRANPERFKSAVKAWRERNPGKNAEAAKFWRTRNPEKVHAYIQERDARKSKRVARVRKLMNHFSGRQAWLESLAAVIARRPDVQGLCWLASDIDEFLLKYYYKEAL